MSYLKTSKAHHEFATKADKAQVIFMMLEIAILP